MHPEAVKERRWKERLELYKDDVEKQNEVYTEQCEDVIQ